MVQKRQLEVVVVGVVEAGEERGEEGSFVQREVGSGHLQLLLLLVCDAQLACPSYCNKTKLYPIVNYDITIFGETLYKTSSDCNLSGQVSKFKVERPSIYVYIHL